MKLRDLLDQKGRAVVRVGTDATIRVAAQAMVDARVGSVLVLGDQNDILGILTERDVLRATAARYLFGRSWDAIARSAGWHLTVDGIHLSDRAGAVVAEAVNAWSERG